MTFFKLLALNVMVRFIRSGKRQIPYFSLLSGDDDPVHLQNFDSEEVELLDYRGLMELS